MCPRATGGEGEREVVIAVNKTGELQGGREGEREGGREGGLARTWKHSRVRSVEIAGDEGQLHPCRFE